MTFGEALKAARTKKGFTQQELAEALGCDIAMVSMMESGKREPGKGLALALERVLGIECVRKSYEFYWKDDPEI